MPSREDYLTATREGQLIDSVVPQPVITFERVFLIGDRGGYSYSYWTTLTQNGEDFIVSATIDDGVAEDTANRLAKAFDVEVNRVGF